MSDNYSIMPDTSSFWYHSDKILLSIGLHVMIVDNLKIRMTELKRIFLLNWKVGHIGAY